MGKSSPAPTTPGAVLKPPGPPGAAVDDSRFRVVFSAPEGKAADASEITVVFSRPLRALEHDVPPPPIKMTPALAGHWLWVGSRALRFVPKGPGRLSGATRVEIEVSDATRALDGTTLGKAHRFAFETPRPSLAGSSPEGGGHVPKTQVDLDFNLPIEPAELEKHLALTASRQGSVKTLAFRVERADAKAPKRLRVIPKSPLPLDSIIGGEIKPGVRSTEGPLPSAVAQNFDFSTYGPLRVTQATCWAQKQGCGVGSAPYIEFSNPVTWGKLKRALSITPALKLEWETWQEDAELTRDFVVPARFEPGRSYTVRIAGDLSDRFGQKLGSQSTNAFQFADYPATVEIGLQGENLPLGSGSRIPVGAVNLSGYDLTLASLRPEDALAFEEAGDYQKEYGVLLATPGSKNERVVSTGPKNRVVRHEVDLVKLLPAGRGVMGLAVATSGERASRFARVVKASDLAVTAKLGSEGSLVWVTRLSSSLPVADAEVEFLRKGQPTRRYRTDAHGLVTIPAAEFSLKTDGYVFEENAIVLARSGSDWTYEAASRVLPPWRLPVPSDLSRQDRRYGMMFTDRGVYRAGDEVRVKGIVRRETRAGNAVVVNESIDVHLASPNGEVVERRKVTTSAFGTFSLSARVPATGELGTYYLTSTPNDASAEVRASFEVAEYRPAEFSVNVVPSAPSYQTGQTARFEARGDYLFGAPMSKAKARWTVSRAPEGFEVPGHEAFTVSSDAYRADLTQTSLSSGTIGSGEGELDASGRLVIAQTIALPGQRGPERILASVEVTDPSRQVIAGEASTLVHPAEFYIGIETPKDWFFTTPGGLAPKVLALSPRGERLAGRRVRLELVARRWTLAREVAEDRDAHAVSQVVDRVVSSCEIVTASERRGCTLDAKEGGYYLVVARATDARNNPVEAAIGMYGLGSGRFGWGDDDRARVAIVPNKKEYKVGETAKLLVKSPFQEAEALVTVERAGVYRSEHKKLVGSLPTIEIPITDDLRPNAYVAVHLLRGRSGGKKEAQVGASYRMGYADLRVDPEARRVKVQVKPSRREARPGETVRVDLAVTDARGAGRQTELAVFAVDEGVLALTGYRTPDPVPVFTASRPLGIATLETREALARIGLRELEGVLGSDKGRDGGGGGPESARRDFRQTAFFEPSVLTDDKGRASVSFKLPDALTTYRVMAVAVTKDDRYGFGAEKVTANKKLMARPALPRFLRSGDVVDAGVVVSKKGLGAGAVRVTAEVTGLVVEGPTTRDVEVGSDESVEVRFRLRAPRVGNSKLRFLLSGAGQSDAVEVERRVQAPLALEAVALYGQTNDRSAEKLGGLSGLDPDAGGLEVRVASTALVGLDTSMGELVEYPYACTEQLSSRLLPLVPLRDLAKDFGLPLPKNADAVAERTIGEILGRQRPDGGFALWPESPDTRVWVSAYALWVLHEAAQRGARVPKGALERGRAFLRERLAHEWERDPASSAFALDVLAMLGAPDLGYAKRLLERSDKLPLFAKGLVLHALAVGKAPSSLRDPLERDISNRLRISGDAAYVAENVGSEYAPLMDSPTRTSAIVLRAILAQNENHALVVPLVRGLLAQRRGGAYRTTQENAFALLALDGYRRARETELPSFSAGAWFGDRKLLDFGARGRSSRPASVTLAMAELSKKPNALLTFEKEGSGTVFYEARLRYARRELAKVPLDQGYFVSKTLRVVKPEELAALSGKAPEAGVNRFRAGDLVVADLLVVTPSAREYVVVDDPLPAGFEPVDTKLKTTASGFSSAGNEARCDGCGGDESGPTAGYGRAWYRHELRDDRALFFVDHMPGGIYHYRYFARATTAGRFVVPPTRAEGMYEPETFGRTAAAVVEVE
jgi:alpha-2-macroglobulin